MPDERRMGPIGLARLLALLILACTTLPLVAGETLGLKERLRLELLATINDDRAANHLAPLILDPRSSRMADEYGRRQILDGTTGHFSLDGQPPYLRYSSSGENDALLENTAAWSSDSPFTESMLPELIRRSHEEMIGETPPNDGHRQAILDPWATHAGIGLAWEQGEFRLVEIFLRRHIDWTQVLPRRSRASDHPWGAGKVRDGFRIDTISVHYEPQPHPMSVDEVNRKESYSLPKTQHEYRPSPHLRTPAARTIDGTTISRRRNGDFAVFHDGSFSFDVDFDRGDGVYTVVVWITNEESNERIAASNVSIRVGAISGVDHPIAGSR